MASMSQSVLGQNRKAGKGDVTFRSQFRKTETCAFFAKGFCSKGNTCEFAHGADELQQMPNLVKTSFCRQWLKHACPKASADCPFAHGSWELRVTDAYSQNVGDSGGSKATKSKNRSSGRRAAPSQAVDASSSQATPSSTARTPLLLTQSLPQPMPHPHLLDEHLLRQFQVVAATLASGTAVGSQALLVGPSPSASPLAAALSPDSCRMTAVLGSMSRSSMSCSSMSSGSPELLVERELFARRLGPEAVSTKALARGVPHAASDARDGSRAVRMGVAVEDSETASTCAGSSEEDGLAASPSGVVQKSSPSPTATQEESPSSSQACDADSPDFRARFLTAMGISALPAKSLEQMLRQSMPEIYED